MNHVFKIKFLWCFGLVFGLLFLIKPKTIFACTNGATQCSGSRIQLCLNGSWSTVTTCNYGCANGKCKTYCPGGNMRCSSSGNVQACYSNGSNWYTTEYCSYGCTESTDTYAFCNAGVSCCNSFLGSGCYSRLSNSQMCKTGSYVSDSAYLDEYPNLGDTSWRWACQA
ncbi:MAG: hypothetical protein PHX84_03490, partial [Candidatus Shapirobacteria bacterium]|nr:hypothetical protein [Candidatus Shapirobacteria bacterium]